jgi:hypothetical protein
MRLKDIRRNTSADQAERGPRSGAFDRPDSAKPIPRPGSPASGSIGSSSSPTLINHKTLLDRAVLHKMINDRSQHLWSFPCNVLE